MRTQELRERLLVAAYLKASVTGFATYMEPKELADTHRIERLPGQLTLVVDDLERRGLMAVSRHIGGGDEGGMRIQLLASGVEEAEALVDQYSEYGVGLVPGADRYISLTDNQRSETTHSLEEFAKAVRSDNGGDPDDREIALSEIAAFEATIVQNRVASELIERFVNRVISWITSKFTAAIVGVVAKMLIEKLLQLHASA